MAPLIDTNPPHRSEKDIRKRFLTTHDRPAPTDEQVNWFATFQDRIGDVAVRVNDQVADSREKEIALQNLEQALTWIGKAIFQE